MSSLPLDLADLDSVHHCAQRVLDSGEAYDVWINNAGKGGVGVGGGGGEQRIVRRQAPGELYVGDEDV